MHNQLYGIYASYIEQYVALKRELGLKYNMEEFIYTLFDRFTIARGEKNVGITKDLADEWNSKKSNESETYRYRKAVCLNQLSSFLCKLGMKSYLPQLPPLKISFCPHIFSKQEIASIFAACDNITLQSGMKSIIIILPALIRLLYGTGLRISEALSLRNEDINLVDQFLIVRDSKNGTERIIPLSDSLSEVCREYLKYRDKLPLARIDNYFFVSLAGSVCKPDYVRKWFSKILREAGINRNDTGPRLHDLRHTFSVHSLALMAESGMDLYCSLPILSRYLGHLTLESTNSYVRLTSEIYPGLLKDVETVCFNVFPKINLYETE